MSSFQHSESLWESCEIDVFRDKPLGSGAYGIVCKAKYDQLPCAAKLLHPTFLVPGNWAVDKFMQECTFLASLKHPHIVQFLGVHTEKSTGQAVLLMELMDESLTAFLKHHKSSNQLVPINIQVDISHDIALALHYLHTKGIIHRDLSSNNILLIGGCRAKITDFGMSKLTLNVSSSLSSLTQVPGCPVYMPPEAWISPPIYTEKLDIFSFGVLMLQIANCKQPNPEPSETLVTSEASPTGYIKVPVPEAQRRKEDIECMDSSHVLRKLTLNCLQDKADPRPSATETCQTLENIKSSQQYLKNLPRNVSKIDLEKKTSKGDMTSDRKDSLVNNNEHIELMKKQMLEKDLEIKRLNEEVSKLSSEVLKLQNKLLQKEQEMMKLEKKPELKKEAKTLHRVQSDQENVCLTGLSPEVLSVISRDPTSSVPNFNVGYHDISRGEVSFQYLPEVESKEQTIKVFLQFYQHIFNSCQLRVGFVTVPEWFPQSLIPVVLKLCSSKQKESLFKHIQIVNMVKVVSSSPTLHEENIDRLTNLLNLRVKLAEGKTLTIKLGNIVEEDVSVIVSSTNPSLIHRFGIAAAINAASLFEVQKHTTAYVKKHGPVDVGCIAHTKAGGNLKCEWIIHAVGPTGILMDDKKVNKELREEVLKTMKGLIHKILRKAEELQAKSIAIPAISTGSLQLALSLATAGILEGVAEHKFTSSSRLADIRIILMRKDVFTKFAEAFINYHVSDLDIKPVQVPPSSHSLSISSLAPPTTTSSSCKQQ